MIVKLFNGKFLIVQFAVVIGFLTLMLSRDITLYQPEGFGPIYHIIYQALAGQSLLVYIVYIVLIGLEGFLLQFIVSYYNLVPRNNFTVLIVWLILIFSNPTLSSINPVLIAAIISTWALFRLLSIGDKDNPIPNLYTAGFLFSFSSFIYGNMLWFLGFLIISLLVLSVFKAHELVVSLIAYATPYIFLFSYGFVFDQEYILWDQFHFNIGNWSFFDNGPQLWISISTSLLITGFSIFAISKVMLQLFSKLIQIRKYTSTIFTMLLASVAIQFLSGPWWFSHPVLIFIPLSILIAIFLSEQKRTLYYDIIILTIMALEVAQLYYLHYA